MLAKSNLNSTEVLICKALIDSNISLDEFVQKYIMCSKNMIWKKKSKIQRLNQFIEDFSLFIKQCYHIVWSVEKILSKTKNGRTSLLSEYAVCDSKKSKFINEQKASGLLSSLGIKTSLSKIPLVGPLLI